MPGDDKSAWSDLDRAYAAAQEAAFRANAPRQVTVLSKKETRRMALGALAANRRSRMHEDDNNAR